MGIEDEDLGEGSPSEKLAAAIQEVEVAERKLKILKDEGASKAEIAAYEQEILDLKLKQQAADVAVAQNVEETLRTSLELLEALHKIGEADEQAVRDAQEKLDKQIELNKEKEAEVAVSERQAAIDKRRDKFAQGFIKRFTGLEDGPGDTLIGNMIFDPAGTVGSLGKEFSNLATPLNITKNVMLKVAESTLALAVEQDQAVVNFRRATGASGEFDDNIRGLERSLFTAGVGAAEAGQAVQTLFLNVTDFTEMSETQQKTLGETVAILNELGVASDTAAKNIQFATKAMGMSTDQAAELQRELFTFAQDLGVSAGKIAEDFQSMGPQIAALGANGVDAFRKLEVQAKNTGLQLSEILGIVEKFDKFDTAAESVGKLNALLGGPYLNTLELVAETDPSKRFEILKDRVDAAGISFDEMDYYQRKAMASAMGLNEQQLALMMRGRLDLIQEPQKSAAEIEELAVQTAQFNTLMEEMKQMGMALAISFGPLVSMLKDFVQIMQVWGRATPIVVAGFGALSVATLAYKGKIEGLTMATIRHGIAERGTVMFGVASLALLVAGLAYFSPVAAKVAVAIGVITAAVVALKVAESSTVILGAIGILAAGISYLANGIVNGFSTPLPVAIGMITTAVFAMGMAFLAFGPMLLPVIALIGAASVVAVGFAAVFTSMFGDGIVNNLQLMAIEVANIVDSINELDTKKAVAYTVASVASAPAAVGTALVNAAMANVGLSAGGGAPAPEAGPRAPAATGPAPTINVHLSIDGTEFETVVNKVTVKDYTSDGRSNLHDSIYRMIRDGFAPVG